MLRKLNRTLASSMIAVRKSILPKKKQSLDPFRDDIAVWNPSPVSAEQQRNMPPAHPATLAVFSQPCHALHVSPSSSILRGFELREALPPRPRRIRSRIRTGSVVGKLDRARELRQSTLLILMMEHVRRSPS